MTSVEQLAAWGDRIVTTMLEWATSPQFYAQIAAIAVAVFAAWTLAGVVRRRVPFFQAEPGEGRFRTPLVALFNARDLLFPVFSVLALAVAINVADAAVGTAWLVRLAQSVSVVGVLYTAITRYLTHPLIRAAAIWVGIPLATLKVFGVLDETTAVLDSISLEVGNIRLSVLMLLKAAVAGGILYWLGRMSNDAGQRAIRRQAALDVPTRELFAKLFQIALYAAIFVILLQVLGLDLTALAVFGGALGVGLGFGLQQIAANFISGVILLLERTIGVGDFIELEDGRKGTLREINMRSSTLATFDGKEIMVPNEKFITTAFTNWTREGPRQRYEVSFLVAYDTDLHRVPTIIQAAVAAHPQVLSVPEEPDCELRGFGESGVEFAVEFWVEGLDDGPNKFSSEVLFIVWDALKANAIAIPLPQREIRLADDRRPLAIRRKDAIA